MIHIHRCTFLAQENSVWENGSTISVNRVKEILSKQLGGLENLPGKIHLKKLTLDLGDFETLEFNGEFIERLEQSCRDLESKLRDLQRVQNDEQNQEEKSRLDELIAFLYSLEYTQQVQNLIYLIESTGFAPKLEDWDKFELRYEQLFGSNVNSELKKSLKSRLVQSKSAKQNNLPSESFQATKSNFGEHDLEQEHFNFLIESLDLIPMNTHWFTSLDDCFYKEFGSRMSLELHNRIRKVYDSFEFGLNQSEQVHSSDFTVKERIEERLVQFFSELGDSPNIRKMKLLLKSLNNSNSTHFYSDLMLKYQRDFGEPLPAELESQLLRFQQTENPLTWNKIDRTKRQRILNKLKIFKALKSNSSRSKKENQSDFSEEEYAFLRAQLSQLFLDASWYSKLMSNYQEKFQHSIPEKLQHIFLKFSQDIFIPEGKSIRVNEDESDVNTRLMHVIRMLDSESSLLPFIQSLGKNQLGTRENFQSSYRDYFGRDISENDGQFLLRVNRIMHEQALNKILLDSQKQVNDLLKQELKHTNGANLSDFNESTLDLKLFEDLSFDLAWVFKINARYREVFQRKLPRRILQKILAQLRKSKMKAQEDIPFFVESVDNGKVRISHFREFLIGLKEMTDAIDLIRILPPNDSSQKFLEIDEVISGFEAYYGSKISSKLKRLIWNFQDESVPHSSRCLSKELSVKAKITLEKNIVFQKTDTTVEPKSISIFKDFLSNELHFESPRDIVVSDFQRFYFKTTGRVLSPKDTLYISKLCSEIQTEMSSVSAVNVDLKKLRSEFNAKVKSGNTDRGKLHESDKKLEASSKRSSPVLHPDFIQPAIDFILNFLEQSTLKKHWLNSLKEVFQKEFRTVIPKDWLDLLNRYETNSMNGVSKVVPFESLKPKLIDFLARNSELVGSDRLMNFLTNVEEIASLEELFAAFERYKNEALPEGLKMMIKKWFDSGNFQEDYFQKSSIGSGEFRQNQLLNFIENYMQTKEEDSQELKHFLQYKLRTVPLDSCWIATVTEHYKRHFKRNISAELLNQLLKFTNDFGQELNYSFQRIEAKQTNESDLQKLYDELAAGMDSSESLGHLKEVLLEMSLSKGSFSIVKVIERFKQKFNEDLPHELLERLILSHARMAKQRWSFLPKTLRENLIEAIKGSLKSERWISTNYEEFNAQFTFLIRTLERTSIGASWFGEIIDAYEDNFGAQMPNSLRECLLSFSEKLTAADVHSDKRENRKTFNQKAIDYFLERHFSTEISENLRAVLVEMKGFENARTTSGLVSRYESKFTELTASQKASIIELEKLVFGEVSTSSEVANLDGLLAEINRKNEHVNSAQMDEEWIDPAMLEFTANFFAVNQIDVKNLHIFESKFQDCFKVKIDARLSALILKYFKNGLEILDKESVKYHEDSEVQNPIDFENKIATNSNLDFQIESNLFLSSKLEQLILGWTNLDKVQGEYLECFGEQLPASLVDSLTTQLYSKNNESSDESTIINELNQFLRKNGTSNQYSVLSQLLESTSEISQSNWFESLLAAHKAQFNSMLPLDMQQLLLSFANRNNRTTSNDSKADIESIEIAKNNDLTEWKKFTENTRNELNKNVDTLLSEQHNFISEWLRKRVVTLNELKVLEIQFYKRFRVAIPNEWRIQLSHFSERNSVFVREQLAIRRDSNSSGEMSTLGSEERVEVRSPSNDQIADERFRNELLSYIETLPNTADKNVLINLIRLNTNLSKSSWFEQLLNLYKLENKRNMPIQIQSLLLKFLHENSRVISSGENGSNSEESMTANQFDDLEDLNSILDESYINTFASNHSEIDLKEFTASLFEGNRNHLENFKLWFGKNVPTTIEKLLLNSNSGKATLKSRLNQFLRENNAKELIQLLAEFAELTQNDWMEQIEVEYALKFNRSVSEKEQKLMMKFAANDEFTLQKSSIIEFGVEHNAESMDQIIAQVESNRKQFIRFQERFKLIEEFLKINNKQPESPLNTDELERLQQKMKVYFDTSISRNDVERMVKTVGYYSKLKGSNSNARTKLRPIKQTKRKMISNKVKLIRLREELKAIKDGKKVDDSLIVMNAGLVFGWVFWKSIFSGFSWLNDGKFIRTADMNSANFAANWLHYSVGERESINPLILFICGLDESEFVNLSAQELEAEMNGENLSNSVEGYYQLILSMWPIFELEQLPDFISLFVDREAIMQESPVGVKLKLVKEPIDALTNNNPIPWPISLINFSWITQIIEVEW